MDRHRAAIAKHVDTFWGFVLATIAVMAAVSVVVGFAVVVGVIDRAIR